MRGVRRRPDIEGKFALFGNTINAENPLGNGAGPQTNAFANPWQCRMQWGRAAAGEKRLPLCRSLPATASACEVLFWLPRALKLRRGTQILNPKFASPVHRAPACVGPLALALNCSSCRMGLLVLGLRQEQWEAHYQESDRGNCKQDQKDNHQDPPYFVVFDEALFEPHFTRLFEQKIKLRTRPYLARNTRAILHFSPSRREVVIRYLRVHVNAHLHSLIDNARRAMLPQDRRLEKLVTENKDGGGGRGGGRERTPTSNNGKPDCRERTSIQQSYSGGSASHPSTFSHSCFFFHIRSFSVLKSSLCEVTHSSHSPFSNPVQPGHRQ